MSVLHLDFETASSADIRKVGLENYVNSADFTVTVAAWAFDDEEVQCAVWPAAQFNIDVGRHIRAGGEIRAWNASFEFAVLRRMGYDARPEQMVCTMQKALAYGLPAGLLKAGRALKLPIVKDESKRLLMLSMSRPRRDGGWWHQVDEGRLAELADYCVDDVRAERAIDAVVPDLHPFERRLSLLDGKINRKGILIDVRAVTALRAAASTAMAKIDEECTVLTNGAVTAPGSQTAKLLLWLKAQGLSLPDVAKDTIDDLINSEKAVCAPENVNRVLELRQMAAKNSVAKLERMRDVASMIDFRARHLLQFYGAGRTARWAGRLVQPQNLPRVPEGHDAEEVIALAGVNGVQTFYSSPMDAISKSLRSCFVAKPGHVLVSVDLSQIEARVLAYLAEQDDVLDTFRRGEDVYTLAAKKVGSDNRTLGKVLTLACGYGMGAGKFQATARNYGLTLTDAEAEDAVRKWRSGNRRIVAHWNAVEDAVRNSLRHRETVVRLENGISVRTKGGITQIKKPSGAKLTYHNMRFDDGSLVFDGVNGLTKQWGTERTYGGRLVENVVQSVARDVMADGMLAPGSVPVMTVHDEIIWEVPEGAPIAAMTAAPEWAKGLPVASKTTIGRRYAK